MSTSENNVQLMSTFNAAINRVQFSAPSSEINIDLARLYRIALGIQVPDKCPHFFSSNRGLYKVTKKYNLNRKDIQNDAIRTYIYIAQVL